MKGKLVYEFLYYDLPGYHIVPVDHEFVPMGSGIVNNGVVPIEKIFCDWEDKAAVDKAISFVWEHMSDSSCDSLFLHTCLDGEICIVITDSFIYLYEDGRVEVDSIWPEKR